MKEERKLYIDLLRIVACISVVMLHSSSQYWYDLPVTDSRWMVYNIWDAVSRFGVPVFVMISGMLFLSREGELDLCRLYKSNLFRLAVAYGAWSVVYGLWDCRTFQWSEGVTVRDVAAELVLGRYHLWFIPMLAGIYILLPVIKTFTDHCSKKCLTYFLTAFVVLQVGRNTLSIVRIPTLANVLVQLLDVEMVCSYVGYFVLGYYLYRYRPCVKWQKRLYVLGGLGLVAAPVVSCLVSRYEGMPKAEAFDSFSLFTFLVTVAVFVFFQEKISRVTFHGVGKKLLMELSANTFGVYLIHLLVMEWLQANRFDSLMIGEAIFGEGAIGCAFGIPFLTVSCYIICNLVISLLRRVPLLGKYVC